MTNDHTESSVDRRLLLRGGALMAGAAGVAVVGAAMAPGKAEAADGQFAVVGQPNTEESSMRITIRGNVSPPGSDDAALTLTNAAGPALLLTPVGSNYDGGLSVGQIASTTQGPEVGVDRGQGDGVETTWIATGADLDQIPVVFPVQPERLVDTRSAAGREGIRTTSAGAFDATHRLKAGAFADIAIAPIAVAGVQGAFLNVTAVAALAPGHLTVCPPGNRPFASTLNFQRGQTLANGAFILCGVAPEDEDWWVVRVYTNAAVHVVVDLTGVTLLGVAGSRTSPAPGSPQQRHAAKINRMKRVFR